MTASINNSKVDEIRHSVQSSYAELNRLIAERLATLDPAKLYQQPAENEWTIMEGLAHIVEFMPYWADEIEKLVAALGQNFGRTMQDSRRLQAINEHGLLLYACITPANQPLLQSLITLHQPPVHSFQLLITFFQDPVILFKCLLLPLHQAHA